MPFFDDFSQMAKDNSNFRYIPVALDESPENWQGERGRVNEEIIKKHIHDLTSPIFYLSGPEGMVKAMRQLLVNMKVNEDNIRTEEFTGY